MNLYCYCYNNPISYYDSNGHSPVIANWFSASNIFDLTATLGQLMIGGAVITQSFAEEIGADGYSKDAQEAVEVVQKLLNDE